MFSDETLDGVEFKSSWKKERTMSSSGCQTSDIQINDVASQVIKRVHQEIQTVPEPEKSVDLSLLGSRPPGLAEFMARVLPDVCKYLDENTKSHAFDGYEVDWEDENEAVTCLHVLEHAALNRELQCTNLSWNSNGSTLAAAYGRMDHQDWCTHKGSLCTWNVDRGKVSPTKADSAIDTSSCLMCVTFHPTIPALIAGGTFNGEVMIWDLSKDDDNLIAASGISDDTHREPVTQITWLQDPNKLKKYDIISTSADGKILHWLFNEKGVLKLEEGFVLLASSLPAMVNQGSRSRGDGEMGVNGISFVEEDKSQFVLGSESGGVFKCSMNSKASAPTGEILLSVPLYSPVTFAFQPHNGPVHAVQCSPFHRNLFMSCGTDMSIRVYSMLESRPIFSIEPASGYLFSAQWSPVRPLVFGAATGQGQLLLYDLKKSKVKPVCILDASLEKKPVHVVQFNQRHRRLLATGDALGTLMIWQLSDELSLQANREMESLADIADSALDL
ncbi:WD repeat-containing protein 34 isoform X1 [Strongylocentrotus purpuratus]|uniref:WD repeat-containing protein 34 n=3 Tax=Strongylocentrotus purpuratus TaxID=7668 RepID=A0A7M7P0S2_STRPU|nr:WD repeat-containing protein 34 isoform X1 [Strongylocentrotus purpuratus]